MTMIPWYSPRGETIIELISRFGDIRARGARAKGAMWGNAVARMGQGMGGLAEWGVSELMRNDEEKKQLEAEQRLDAAFQSWDGKDPMKLYRATAPILGIERGMKVTGAAMEMMKASQGQAPDLKTAVGGLAALHSRMGDSYLGKNWAGIRSPLSLATKQSLGIDLPEEYTPEVGQAILALDAKLNQSKDEGGFTLGPDQVRFDATGKQIAAGPPKPPEQFNLSPNQVRFDTTGKVIATGPPKEPDPVAAAMAQARLDALKDKETERTSEIAAYVDAVGSGDYTIDKVPATIQRQVMVEAERRGFDVRTAKQKEIDAAAEQTIENLSQLREQAERTMTATTGPGAVLQGKAQRGLSYLGLAEETQKWDKQTAKLSLLARQLGEKGVLTDRDVDRVVNMLPKLTEKTEIRDKALQDLEDVIFTGMRGRVSARVKIPGGNQPLEWRHPKTGQVYRFKSAEQRDAFLTAAGIR